MRHHRPGRRTEHSGCRPMLLSGHVRPTGRCASGRRPRPTNQRKDTTVRNTPSQTEARTRTTTSLARVIHPLSKVVSTGFGRFRWLRVNRLSPSVLGGSMLDSVRETLPDSLTVLLAADLDEADRDSVARYVKRSRELRSWLD